MKIKKVATGKHDATNPPFIRAFVATGVDTPTEKLAEHLSTFPRLWPFPRGDLYHWIPLLNKFDDVLEEAIVKYKLRDGPQQTPWEESDEKTLCAVLGFSRMLVEECGNRSLYASSSQINDLLNTTSLDVLEHCLRLSARLAQRYYTSKSRGSAASATNQALLLSHYNINLDKIQKITAPFSKIITASSPKTPGTPGAIKTHVPVFANDLGALARESSHTTSEKGKGKASDEWDHWGRVTITYYSNEPTKSAAGPTSPGAQEHPASPTLHRRATHPQPTLGTPARRETESFGTGDQNSNGGMQTLEVPGSKVRSSSMEEIIKTYLPQLPKDVHYEFLQKLRVAWALTHGLQKRRQILGIRILALTNAAYVLSDSAFLTKVLAVDNDEPRRLQIAYQLADLVSGASDKANDAKTEVPRWLQAYAFGALEALARQKHKTTDVCAAMSMNVNHGVLMYVVRKLLAEISTNVSPEDEDITQEEWRSALFGLLQFLPSVVQTGQLVVAAGLMPVLVEISTLRTPLASKAMPKIIALMDSLIYGVPAAFTAFTSANGMDIIVDLIKEEVEGGLRETADGKRPDPQYRSPAVDFQITHLRQHTLKSLWKFLGHMMVQNSGGNVDRLLRNLIDNPKSMEAMKLVMSNAKVFGNAIWSSCISVFSSFIHNEPTSYAAIHEAGLSQVFLESVGGVVRPEEPKKEEDGKDGSTEEKKEGDAMDVDTPVAEGSAVPATTDTKPQEPEKPKVPVEELILPSAEAMTVIPTAIGAICLNNSGLSLIQRSNVLETFFELFASSSHVKVLADNELSRIIGSQFDELVRHHPVLKEPIMKAVFDTSKRVLKIGEDFAEKKNAGAKVWAEDGKGGIIVSGGKKAIVGRARSEAAPSTGQFKTDDDEDVDMTDAGPATTTAELPTPRGPDGSAPQEIVTAEQVTEDDDYVPVMAMDPREIKDKEPGASMYIEVLGNFLEGFFANKAQAKEFVERDGLDILLGMYKLPSLPYNFAVRVACGSMNRVLHVCAEHVAQKTVNAVLEVTLASLEKLKPLLEYNGQKSFFAPLIKKDGIAAVAPRLQGGPPSDVLPQEEGDGEYASEFLRVDGTTTIKNLTTVHAYASLLTELYAHNVYGPRTGSEQYRAVTQNPLTEKVIGLLGQLHRTCVYEEILIARSLPEDWDKATKSEGAGTDTVPTTTDSKGEPKTESETKKSESSKGKADAEKDKPKEPKVTDKADSCLIKNAKTIRFLLSNIPNCVTPFVQGVARCLILRRHSDLSAKQTAFRVSEAITDVAHQHLLWKRVELAEKNSDKIAYWLLMLTGVSQLLIDDHYHSYAITVTLKTFLQNGGFKTIVDILNTFWEELVSLPPVSSGVEQPKEEHQKMAQIYGGIKIILTLFNNVVNYKAITEAQQTQLLSQTREKERADYFQPGQFVVEIRAAVLPAVQKIWDSTNLDRASTSIVKTIIEIMSSILRAEGETNALSRKDNPKSTKLSWRTMEPSEEKVRTLVEMGFTREEAQSALLRTNGNLDRATEYLISFTGDGRNESRTSSRPRTAGSNEDEGTEADSPRSESRDDSVTPAAVPIPVPVPETVPAPAPATAGGSSTAPQPATASTNQPTSQPQDTEMEVEAPESSSAERAERLVVMSIDNLLTENASPVPGTETATPAPEEPAATTTTSSAKGKEKAVVDEDPITTVEDLDEMRNKLRDSLVERCLDILKVHEGVTFDLAALIDSAFSKTSDNAADLKRDIVETIVQSLVSLQDEDLRPQGKAISSTAHMLGLLLQVQEFYKAVVDDLRSQIPVLVSFLKVYPNEPAPWVPNVLLVIEKILSEDAQPKAIKLDIPELTQKEEGKEIIDCTISLEDKQSIFDAVVKLIPEIQKDEVFALATVRVLFLLTRRREIAEQMVPKKHLHALFALFKRQIGTATHKLQSAMLLVLHNIVEDKETIKNLMRSEIRTYFEQKGTQHLDTHILTHYHLVLRDPEAFVEVTNELCKFRRFDSNGERLKYQQIILKEKDLSVEPEEEKEKKEEVKDGDAMETEVEGEAGKPSESAGKEEKVSEQEKAPEQTKTKDEVKPPIVDKPDGVVHFLVTELLSCKDQEEPPLPPHDEADYDREVKEAMLMFDVKPAKPEQRTGNNPVFVYRTFILNCLTEMLANFNRSKIEFINYNKKARPTEPITPSKPRSGILNHIIYDLVPVGTIAHKDELAHKKRVALSNAAMPVIVALVSHTGENSKNEASELLFIRKFVLESLLRAFKEATTSAEPLDMRYSRLIGLCEIFSRMLTAKPISPSSANIELSATFKQIAKIMLEKNFIGAFNFALAEVDLNFPNVRRAIKYLLRPLRFLSKTALELSEITEVPAIGTGDEDEISTASSLDEDDYDREETPDLYRHSALGMFDAEQMEEDAEESYDEDDDDDLEDYEMDYDDDEDDEGSEMSDEANEIDPAIEGMMDEDEGSEGTDEDDDDISDDDMDEDGGEIEIIDEMEEDIDDDEDVDDDDLDEVDIDDDDDEPDDYEDNGEDWPIGGTQPADIVVSMDDPLDNIARVINADHHGLDHALEDDFVDDDVEEEDEEDDDIDDEDDDDRGDEMDHGTIPVPWEFEQDLAEAHIPFLPRVHSRPSGAWFTLGQGGRGPPILGVRQIRVGGGGGGAPLDRSIENQLNPLLSSGPTDFLSNMRRGGPDGMTDWVHSFESLNPRADTSGAVAMMNTLIQLLSRTGQMPPAGSSIQFSIPSSGHRFDSSRHDMTSLIRRRDQVSQFRDDILSTVGALEPEHTRDRWIEQAKMMFAGHMYDKAAQVLNSILQLLVPPAIVEERERKEREAEAERKRKEELERIAKEKAEEEERLRKEKEEKERKEREERERLEKERAEREAAEAAEAAERAAQDSAAAAAAAATTETMEGVEATGSEAPTTQAAPAADAVPPRMVVIRGQEVNVANMGIDPEFLEALPEELRDEVFTNHLRERQMAASQSDNPSSEISPEFLAALPDEIREELLAQEAADRRQREREAARAQQGGARGPEEMDLQTFLATLDPALRQTVLLEQDDEALAQLPGAVAAEAAALRRTAERRMGPFVEMHRRPVESRTADAPRPVKKTIRKSHAQLLDRAGVATIMRLMFIPQGTHVSQGLHELLLNVCENRHNRVEVINLLLSIIEDGTTDMIALEKCFLQLSFRARQPVNPQRTPLTPKRSGMVPIANNEITPLVVIQQCLATLMNLVTSNELIRSYFLNEHEVPKLVKRSASKKGKGKEKDLLGQHNKAGKYALNILLALLDRKMVTENSSVMDLLSQLLSNITRPLTVLKKEKKKAEEEKKEDKKEEEKKDEGAPAEQEDAGEGSSKAKEERKEGEETEEPDKKEKALVPPVVPDSNLCLVVNILSAPECSSKTFKETLTAMQNLSAIPGARDVFGGELIRQAQVLGKSILQNLTELIPQIKSASTSTEVQGLALSKFSPSSSDQAKLLRLLTAVDYLFDPKREKRDENTAEVEDMTLSRLYESLDFANLWEKLSEALTAIHERPEMLHVATILLPLIETLMVVCKGSGLKETAPRGGREKTPSANLKTPALAEAPGSSMENLFFKFTEDHRKILNQMVRNSPKLMSGSFALLVNNPKVLDFDNKRNYFTRRLHTRGPNAREVSHTLQLNVRRKEVFLDTYKSMYFKSGDEIKYAKLNIRFSGEEGVDAGGVTREWFQVLARQMFNPDYALFLPVASDRTTFHPNPLSGVNPEHLSFFKFIGRIIGKALYEGRVLDCHFSRAVYKRILGKSVALKDMETIDLDYYRSLCWILENNIDDVITETFSVVSHKFGVEEVVDLIPDGRNIPVTEENKHEYVRLVVEYRLLTSVKEQMEEFLKGFHDIVPAELVSIFNEQELELLISGLPDIDLDDWRAHTEYHNYTASSPQIQWFWRAVRGFDKEERAKLLQFVTGTSKVPLNGFKELEGMNGVARFNIHRDYGSKDRLPSSHTCFNQLDLPEYDSYEDLRKSLYTAITQGADYFGFA